jgi:hypothetical protein
LKCEWFEIAIKRKVSRKKNELLFSNGINFNIYPIGKNVESAYIWIKEECTGYNPKDNRERITSLQILQLPLPASVALHNRHPFFNVENLDTQAAQRAGTFHA